MKAQTHSSYIMARVKEQRLLIEKTAQAKADYKDGKISILEMHKKGTFEKSAAKVEFFGCMNIRNGVVESGKLVKIDGNFDHFGSVKYFSDSVIECYKVRFYDADGSVVIRRAHTEMNWRSEDITRVFDLEYIFLCLKNLSKTKRRHFVVLLKSLCKARYHIDYDMLIKHVEHNSLRLSGN